MDNQEFEKQLVPGQWTAQFLDQSLSGKMTVIDWETRRWLTWQLTTDSHECTEQNSIYRKVKSNPKGKKKKKIIRVTFSEPSSTRHCQMHMRDPHSQFTWNTWSQVPFSPRFSLGLARSPALLFFFIFSLFFCYFFFHRWTDTQKHSRRHTLAHTYENLYLSLIWKWFAGSWGRQLGSFNGQLNLIFLEASPLPSI